MVQRLRDQNLLLYKFMWWEYARKGSSPSSFRSMISRFKVSSGGVLKITRAKVTRTKRDIDNQYYVQTLSALHALNIDIREFGVA